MYFNVKFNLCFKLIEVQFLVSELNTKYLNFATKQHFSSNMPRDDGNDGATEISFRVQPILLGSPL